MPDEDRPYQCYRGKYACPKCGGKETGTNTVMTSGRWIIFTCDCGHRFRKSALTVSPGSAWLRGVAHGLSEVL